MQGLCDQSLPQMGSLSFLIMSVGSQSTSGREKKERQERMGKDLVYKMFTIEEDILLVNNFKTLKHVNP